MNKLGTSLKEAVSEHQEEQAYLKDAEMYEALLSEIKKYDNGLSDDDYAGQEYVFMTVVFMKMVKSLYRFTASLISIIHIS